MDEIDLKIILLLMNNSRLTYREISEYLNLSVNAVFKRVQSLIDLRIIERFVTRIKPYAINAIYTFIFGQSNSLDVNTKISELGKHDDTWQIMLSSRNYMYIGAILENIHQLDEYASFVSQTVEMQSPKIGFLSGVQYKSPIPYIIPKSGIMNFDKLDVEIIRSLHKDSRKPISEIADDILSTSNTVRRRLNRLVDEGVVELSIDFNPQESNDIFALLQISTNPMTDKLRLAKELNEKYDPHLFYCWTFSNLPNLIVCWVWVNSMKELTDLVENIKREKVESILFDIMSNVYYFDTWKEKLLYK